MANSLHHTWSRTVAAFVLASIFASPVLADTVMLRSGTQVKGTLANRELFRVLLPRMDSIAILATDSTNSEPVLRRFEVAEVDAVVLEQDGKLTVFDLKKPAAAPRSVVLQNESRGISEFPTQLTSDGTGAAPAVLAAAGILAFAVGVAVKFGGPTVKITSTGITGEENSYNVVNYGLLGGGVALTTIGIVTAAFRARSGATISHFEAPGPTVPPSSEGPAAYVGVRIAF